MASTDDLLAKLGRSLGDTNTNATIHETLRNLLTRIEALEFRLAEKEK